MGDHIVYQNESAVLRYYPVERIVHHTLLKRPRGPDFRGLLETGYQLVLKNRATKWLSDDRLISVLTEEDESWARHDWFPRVAKAGWLYWAIVDSEKEVGKLLHKRHATEYQSNGVTVSRFTSPDDALRWLRTAR